MLGEAMCSDTLIRQEPNIENPSQPPREGFKLILAIVQKEDAGGLIDALTAEGHRATRIDATGGFLRKGNALILIGAAETNVDAVLAVIEGNCRVRKEKINIISPVVEVSQLPVPSSTEVVVGGATVFVLSVSRFERL